MSYRQILEAVIAHYMTHDLSTAQTATAHRITQATQGRTA